MDIRDIRRERLRLLLAEAAGKQVVLAKRIKKAPAQISQWINSTRTLTEDTAREIEKEVRKPPGWMDQPITASESTGSYQTRALLAKDPPRDEWPFSPELFQAIERLSKHDVTKLEAMMRVYLELPPLPVASAKLHRRA